MISNNEHQILVRRNESAHADIIDKCFPRPHIAEGKRFRQCSPFSIISNHFIPLYDPELISCC